MKLRSLEQAKKRDKPLDDVDLQAQREVDALTPGSAPLIEPAKVADRISRTVEKHYERYMRAAREVIIHPQLFSQMVAEIQSQMRMLPYGSAWNSNRVSQQIYVSTGQVTVVVDPNLLPIDSVIIQDDRDMATHVALEP